MSEKGLDESYAVIREALEKKIGATWSTRFKTASWR